MRANGEREKESKELHATKTEMRERERESKELT